MTLDACEPEVEVYICVGGCHPLLCNELVDDVGEDDDGHLDDVDDGDERAAAAADDDHLGADVDYFVHGDIVVHDALNDGDVVESDNEADDGDDDLEKRRCCCC